MTTVLWKDVTVMLMCSLEALLVKLVFGGDRIQTVLRAIKQMQTHARQYRRQIEDRLLASQENSKRVGSSACQ